VPIHFLGITLRAKEPSGKKATIPCRAAESASYRTNRRLDAILGGMTDVEKR
jgi:hypothetical protein